VLGDALRKLGTGDAPRVPRAFGSALANLQVFDLTQRLLPSLLRYEDRNSMAFSIETRLPFLDYRLVEFALSLPDEQRLDGDVTKVILRRSLGDRIPASILARRDKMGFETPTDPWLRGRYSAEVRRRLLTDGPLHQWVKRGVMEDELERYLSGQRDVGLQVWRWLSLEAWSRRYVSGDPRVTEREPEAILHAGRHRTYVEVARALAREAAGSSAGS
jgi:asparagine synthase (glutamine-hydrolysing)